MILKTNQALAQRDLAVLWHPCTQMHDHETMPMIPIKKGQGVWLEDFLVPKLSLGMPTFKLCLMFNRDEYHYSLCFAALHTGYATINYSDKYIR